MPRCTDVEVFHITERGKYAADHNGARGDISWNLHHFPPFYGQYDGQILTRDLTVYATGVETYDIFNPPSSSTTQGYQIPKLTFTYRDVWDSGDDHWETTWTSNSFLWNLTTSQNWVSDGFVMTEQAQVICGAWGKAHHTITNVRYLGKSLVFPTISFDQVDDFIQNGDGYTNAHAHAECHILGGDDAFSILCDAWEAPSNPGYIFLDIYTASFDFRFEGPMHVKVNPKCSDIPGTPISGQYNVVCGSFYHIDPTVSDYYPQPYSFTDADLAAYKKTISTPTTFDFPIKEVFHRCKVIHARGDGTNTWLNETPLNDMFNQLVRSTLTNISVTPDVQSFLGINDPTVLDHGPWTELRPLLRFNKDSGVTVKQIGKVRFDNQIAFNAPAGWSKNDSHSTIVEASNLTRFHCETSENFNAPTAWTIRPYRYFIFDVMVTSADDVNAVIILNQPSIGGVNPITHTNYCGPVQKFYRATFPGDSGVYQSIFIDTCNPYRVYQSGPANLCSLDQYNLSRVTTQNNGDKKSNFDLFSSLVEKFSGICSLTRISILTDGPCDFEIINWRIQSAYLEFHDLGHVNLTNDALTHSHWGEIDGKDAFRSPAGATCLDELNNMQDYQQFSIRQIDTALPFGVWPSDILDLDDLLTKRFGADSVSHLGWVSNYDAGMNRMPIRTDLYNGGVGIPVYFTVAPNSAMQLYMGVGDSSMLDPDGVFTLDCEMVLGNAVSATILGSIDITPMELIGTDIVNAPFTETYNTSGGDQNYGRHYTNIERLGSAGVYHYKGDIKHQPVQDIQPQLLWLTSAKVVTWAAFGPKAVVVKGLDYNVGPDNIRYRIASDPIGNLKAGVADLVNKSWVDVDASYTATWLRFHVPKFAGQNRLYVAYGDGTQVYYGQSDDNGQTVTNVVSLGTGVVGDLMISEDNLIHVYRLDPSGVIKLTVLDLNLTVQLTSDTDIIDADTDSAIAIHEASKAGASWEMGILYRVNGILTFRTSTNGVNFL